MSGLAIAGALAPGVGGIHVALAWLPETRGLDLDASAPEAADEAVSGRRRA